MEKAHLYEALYRRSRSGSSTPEEISQTLHGGLPQVHGRSRTPSFHDQPAIHARNAQTGRKRRVLLQRGIQRLAFRRTADQRRNLSIDARRRTRAQTGRETAVGAVSPPEQAREESAQKSRRSPLSPQSKWFADTCFGRQEHRAGGCACLRRKNPRP